MNASVVYHRGDWSPFDEPPRRRASPLIVVAMSMALAVHVGIGAYLWKARFEPRYRDLSEEVTNVQIVRPIPPPPPPEKAKPKPPPPPKKTRVPKVQPRPPKVVTQPTVAPLPLPPAVERIESFEPPVIRATPPAPPAPPPPPAVITRPDWLRRPTGAEIARYYPDRAARRGVEGRAVIGCTVSTVGRLEGCELVAETPEGEGFGSAALKMSRHFEMKPMTRDGAPVAGGSIRIPIRFALPARA